MRALLAIVAISFVAVPVWSETLPRIRRGEYVFQATGGCACHTDRQNEGPVLAGGRPIQTPFGRVYSTNITPDPDTGIGTWSDASFIRAMTEGVGPNGVHYYPVFPYTAFSRMQERDLLDLKAYLFSVPPVKRENIPADLLPPFGWRFGLRAWKWLYLRPGPFQRDPSRPPEWNRGAYLATALGHCGECHTPRDLLGGLKSHMAYAGSTEGPEGELAPNITPDEATGIGAWSVADIVWFLQTGLKPDGDDAQGLMRELIDTAYRFLTDADLTAIAVYLQSLPPVHHEVLKK